MMVIYLPSNHPLTLTQWSSSVGVDEKQDQTNNKTNFKSFNKPVDVLDPFKSLFYLIQLSTARVNTVVHIALLKWVARKYEVKWCMTSELLQYRQLGRFKE